MDFDAVFTDRKVAPADIEEHKNGYRLQWHGEYDLERIDFETLYETHDMEISETNIARTTDQVQIRQYPCENRPYRAEWDADGTVTVEVYDDLLADEDDLKDIVLGHAEMVTSTRPKPV